MPKKAPFIEIKSALKIYIDLIESIGFFLAAEFTGKKVEIIAVKIAIATKIKNEGMPNTRSEAPRFSAKDTFSTLQSRALAALDSTIQIIAINADSEKKILNTSLPFAPTARRIPISFFF